MTELQSPSDAVGQRIKELRKKRGWSLDDLARVCAEKSGADQLTGNVIENIEHGRKGKDGRRRRMVTVDELLVFADALDVAPIHLLVPIDDEEYPAVPAHVDSTRAVRAWIRGEYFLEGRTDLRVFTSEVPEHEFGKTRIPDETVTFERTQENGQPERRVVHVDSLEYLRSSRSKEWRRIDERR
ncbi:helix-turn-helix transcriptional regulator [Actinomadura sp. NPDC023710]|uniref:helix-turn-helix domain-containing protein n=1 Tax=Actinomadura sp. NPDC023710 TaxID=3158219 RepID=UPI0033E46860